MNRIVFKLYLIFSFISILHGDESIVYVHPYVSYALTLMLLLAMVSLALAYKLFVINYWPHTFLLYIILLLFSSVYSSLNYYDLGSIIKSLVLSINSLFIIMVLMGKKSETNKLLYDWKSINIYFGIIVASLMFLEFIGFSEFETWNNHDELIRPFPVFSNSGIIFEPNVAAVFLFIGWSFLFERFKGIPLLIFNFIFLCAIFLTYSRSIYLMVVFILLTRFRILLYGVLLLSFIFIYNYLEIILEFANIENLLTGRPGMWIYCLSHAPDPMFGFGFSPSNFNLFLSHISEDYVTSHNVLIDMYLSSGLFTAIAFFVFYIYEIYRNIKNRTNYMFLGLLVSLFVLVSPSNFGGLSIISINFSFLLLESRWNQEITKS